MPIPPLFFALLLVIASLMIRHDDGSIVWEAMANLLTGSHGLAVRLIVGLAATLVLARIFPRLIARLLGLMLPAALGFAVWFNYQAFGEINRSERYHLKCNPDDTLLALADASPSEYERNHWGFYLYLDRALGGRVVRCYSADLLNYHSCTKRAHLAELVIEPYSPALPPGTIARFAARPQVVRVNGDGNRFVFFTDEEARRASQFRIMRGSDRYYFVPETPPRP